MRPSLETDEGRALGVILTVLGDFGRGEIRKHLLNHVVDNAYPDAKHTLDVMNFFERAFDQLERDRIGGGR